MDEIERYETVDGGVAYRVGTSGGVWTRRSDGDHWRPLAVRQRGGRAVVRLAEATGQYRQKAVADLVLLAFVGPRPTAKHKPIHANGNRQDCRLVNLSWGLRQRTPRPDNDPEIETDYAFLGAAGIRRVLALYWQYGVDKPAIADSLELEYKTVQHIIDTHPRHDPDKVYHDELAVMA